MVKSYVNYKAIITELTTKISSHTLSAEVTTNTLARNNQLCTAVHKRETLKKSIAADLPQTYGKSTADLPQTYWLPQTYRRPTADLPQIYRLPQAYRRPTG